MLLSYLKIAFRVLIRQRLYSLINLFGLAVGISSTLIILSYVYSEWSYDSIHEDVHAIYRVQINTLALEGAHESTAGQPYPLPSVLKASFPVVEAATSISQSEGIVRTGADRTFAETIFFAEPDFFRVFTFPALSAGSRDLLSDPTGIVITESAARKYFDTTDAIGSELELSLDGPFRSYTVTAVLQDIPYNSSIRFDFLLPVQSQPHYLDLENAWTSWGTNTYVRLREPEDAATLEAGFPAFTEAHYEPMIRTWKILKWIADVPGSFRLSLLPLADVHFANRVQQVQNEAADPVYPYLLSFLALGILLLACINFITLAIGRALGRIREVGLRKVLGAHRMQLVRQFQGEALLFSTLATLLGFALAQLIAPAIGSATGTPFSTEVFLTLPGIGLLAAVLLVTGILSGLYPSLYLARFSPVSVIRKAVSPGKNRWMQVLVISQFTLSAVFVFSVLVVSGQLRFIGSTNPGYEKEHVLVVSVAGGSPDASSRLFERFRQTARVSKRVASVAAGLSGFNRSLAWRSFSTPDGDAHLMYVNRISPNYLRTLGMKMVAGRELSPDYPGDALGAVVVNEALVREYGWQQPIGQRLDNFELAEDVEAPTVVGVVADYNFKSLHNAVEPMVLYLAPRDAYRFFFVRLNPGSPKDALADVRSAWHAVAPGIPFTSSFLDDDFNAQYTADRRWQRVIGYAGILALIIACLGLFGLSAYTTERRMRELGIRKVLGASATGITGMLSVEYLKLVVIAEVLAIPIGWILMQQWLDRFAFRFHPGVQEVAVAIIVVLLIAGTTVSFQAIRAARRDPAESLRYE